MPAEPRLPPITTVASAGLPPSWPRGAYLLRIALPADLALAFGRFRRGSPISLPSGEYIYVGSAMGRHGWPLAARLLRHATRSGDRPPHALRAALVAHFSATITDPATGLLPFPPLGGRGRGIGGEPPEAAPTRHSSDPGPARPIRPPSSKRCHWHVDYLLDAAAADLSHVILVPAEGRLELRLARLLVDDPHTKIVAKGLGAADTPGGTHLLRVLAGEAWWLQLPDRISGAASRAPRSDSR